MKTRVLKWSDVNNRPLHNGNDKHRFAVRHALKIYNANSIYTYIPKNGCTNLRTSLAIANGCISRPEQFDWIHQNNDTFLATLQDLIIADYTFVILRCPFSRLISAFLDKFISKDRVAWSYYDGIDRTIAIDDLSFREFVKSLKRPNILRLDDHWRPQIDFLVYENYDDYFALEDFEQVVSTLKSEINLVVYDTRRLAMHGLDRFKLVKKHSNAAELSASEIFVMQKAGICPSPQSFYSDELVSIVRDLYKEDINFYKEKCGEKKLMFR